MCRECLPAGDEVVEEVEGDRPPRSFVFVWRRIEESFDATLGFVVRALKRIHRPARTRTIGGGVEDCRRFAQTVREQAPKGAIYTPVIDLSANPDRDNE